MKIVRMICDHCHREEQEDDADGWIETSEGDLCPDCLPVYTRDASWWNRPDTRSPKKYHREDAEQGWAACSPGLIMLVTDQGRVARAGEVPATALCRRCFPEGW